ncbi:hypothetical protein Tco_1324235 [Tanacetum coccineum]
MVVRRWSDGGQRWCATVDRRCSSSLATVDQWFDGGSGDSWQAMWHQSQGDTWHSNHEMDKWHDLIGLKRNIAAGNDWRTH